MTIDDAFRDHLNPMMLAARCISVSHETIRQWGLKATREGLGVSAITDLCACEASLLSPGYRLARTLEKSAAR
jgi:hypothetical protein